jgi:serine/threonine protein kinase
MNKLCKTGHPNIVQVLDYGQLKGDTAIYFIDMELCGTTLDEYLKGRGVPGLMAWTEIREKQGLVTENAYNILQHIINALVYIHALGKVHRDLSPQNGICSARETVLQSTRAVT